MPTDEPRVWLGNSLQEYPATAPTWLSPQECMRWNGLGELRRLPFLGSRILMRALLSDELGSQPGGWSLDGRGHPLCSTANEPDGLRTSLSHHQQRIAVALSRGRGGLGIDLERPRRNRRWETIARRWFTPAEQAVLTTCSPAEGERLFYRLWTLKEAWVKANGQGLAGNFQALRMVADGAAWRLEAATAQGNWQAWSGWVGSDCLGIVWQGSHASTPRIASATVALTGCSGVARIGAEAVRQVRIEACPRG